MRCSRSASVRAARNRSARPRRGGDRPDEGIGEPEPLRHELAGAWSRRIDREHRLVDVLDGQADTLCVIACRDHCGKLSTPRRDTAQTSPVASRPATRSVVSTPRM
ncbi:type II toxin-antitoxin system YoeB family toxin [Streptomyces sp. SP17BM10]|uniref:type II toxin-antitoxin system YoeB family toxin n=1 Tax=Streptomyces sp. SP17BM10 TaxID=3002530 RepID=UPI002E7D24EB|nr:type II toxin-antitoxin system YoeB family toxin [Streptomyces sp. SP17BM10]